MRKTQMDWREFTWGGTHTLRARDPISPVVIFQPQTCRHQNRPCSKQPILVLSPFCWVWHLLYHHAAGLTRKEEQKGACLQPYLRTQAERQSTLDGPFNHSGLSVQINSSADSPQNQLGPSAALSTLLKAPNTGKPGSFWCLIPG